MKFNDELTQKLAQAASLVMVSEDNSNNKSDDGEGLDKVQPKAVKKKFDDRKDKDIDNDGDVDSSDEYIHAKRKAISKAVKKEDVDLEEGAYDKLAKKLGRINPETLGDVLAGKIKLSPAEKKEFDSFMKGARKMFASESTDLEEATMSQGVKTAMAQIYSLEKSLKAGSNLNKGVNKSLEGKYDADFKKMEKAIGQIISVWEDIERDFTVNESVDLEKANVLTSDEYDEVQNFQNFNKKDWRWLPKQGKYTRKKKV